MPAVAGRPGDAGFVLRIQVYRKSIGNIQGENVMRNRLAILTLLLVTLYFVGGSDTFIDAVTKVFVLGSVQLLTHLADEGLKSAEKLERNTRRRLKR
jgi:hypothetical protein